MDSGFKKDLRGGFIVALVAVTLFVVLLFQLGAKGAKHGYYFIERLEGAVQPIARGLDDPLAINATQVPVFCYHFIRTQTTPFEFLRILGGLLFNLPLLSDMDIWTQSRSEFEREMRHLHKEGYTSVDLGQLDAWRRGDIRLPQKSVVITFDDGDRSVFEVAFPTLQKYGLGATLFIVTSQVGRAWEGVDGLTWEELAVLQESGVFTIESHTHGLHYKVKTPEGPQTAANALDQGLLIPPYGEPWREVIFNDLMASRRLIAAKLGHDARHLAWPYGKTSASLDSVAVAAGFATMSTLEGGMNKPLDVGRPTLSARDTYLLHVSSDDPLDTGIPAFLPRLASSRFASERHSVRRYIITARTSIRDFKEMLAQ